MSTDRSRRDQTVRHYISRTVFVAACGATSADPGHALTQEPRAVTCPACKALMRAGRTVPGPWHNKSGPKPAAQEQQP